MCVNSKEGSDPRLLNVYLDPPTEPHTRLRRLEGVLRRGIAPPVPIGGSRIEGYVSIYGNGHLFSAPSVPSLAEAHVAHYVLPSSPLRFQVVECKVRAERGARGPRDHHALGCL